ncbi:MAG: bL17 family ribosomal protein [Christensenellales bacterium]|jgi:large subunit ribosomal protein L17
MHNRKLNRSSDQRKAALRSLTTAFIWNGKIVTTEARAKEVRSIAEKLITLAAKEYKNSQEVKKTVKDKNGNEATITTRNDLPSKLHARRQIMAYLYDIKEPKKKGESKGDYHLRTRKINHPVVEKLFNEYGPRYENRNGGYTRIVKMGPRRGDGAEMCILELV